MLTLYLNVHQESGAVEHAAYFISKSSQIGTLYVYRFGDRPDFVAESSIRSTNIYAYGVPVAILEL